MGCHAYIVRVAMKRGYRQAVWLSAGLVLLLVCSSGCASSKSRSGASNAGSGTVSGTLRLVGGPSPGTNRPASGVVYAFGSASLTSMAIAKVNAGDDGKFHLSIPPGTYYLAATSPSFSI